MYWLSMCHGQGQLNVKVITRSICCCKGLGLKKHCLVDCIMCMYSGPEATYYPINKINQSIGNLIYGVFCCY